MPIFASVFLALNEAGVPFLVIGGHAVVLHGHLRNTFDLDLLIAESKLAQARASLTSIGYLTYFETDANSTPLATRLAEPPRPTGRT